MGTRTAKNDFIFKYHKELTIMKWGLRDYGYDAHDILITREHALKLACDEYGKEAVIERLKTLGQYHPVMLEDAERLIGFKQVNEDEMVSEVMKSVREMMVNDYDLSGVELALKTTVNAKTACIRLERERLEQEREGLERERERERERMTSQLVELIKIQDDLRDEAHDIIANFRKKCKEAKITAKLRAKELDKLENLGIYVWSHVEEERKLAVSNWKVGCNYIKELEDELKTYIEKYVRLSTIVQYQNVRKEDTYDNVAELVALGSAIILLYNRLIYSLQSNKYYELVFLEMPTRRGG